MQEAAHDLARGGDLDLHGLLAAGAVGARIGFAGLGVDVLGHVDGELVPGGAEGAAGEVHAVGGGAGAAAGGVAGEFLHNVLFVVTGEARDGGRAEVDLARAGAHFGGWGGVDGFVLAGGVFVLGFNVFVLGSGVLV